MKKVPYGKTDFKNLIESNSIYVDKTMYLEKLEDTADTIIYLRPRRFGKTLFTSMMYYYYDINSKDLYDDLFKDTYIYNNPTKNKNNYYILKIDFSGMSSNNGTIENIEKKFKNRIIEGINKFMSYYDNYIKINEDNNSADILSFFLSSIKLDHKIYVIIDEYDNFTNSLLDSNNIDIFQGILGKNGFVKDFYARIKEYSGSVIDRCFITGVCSISLDSMTSGFNIATNITNEYDFNSMTALEKWEIKNIIKDIPDSDYHLNTMIEYYDGYCFSEGIKEKVFNPTLTMYYLKYLFEKGASPQRLLDSNIISNYEQIKNIVSLGDYKEILDDIFDNGEIVSNLSVNFNLNKKISRSDIISLLYYFGYLTIKEGYISGYRFIIPNRVMKTIYGDYYLAILNDDLIKTYDEREFDIIDEIINNGKLDKLCDYISYLLENMDNRIFINYKEKDLQIMIYTILIRYLILDVYLEYPIGNDFIDMVIFTKNYNYIIELKYIKKKDKKDYKKIHNEAKKEISKYTLDVENKKKFIIIFTGSNYTLEEVV